MNLMKKDRKAQEEMVGFVLIMVIVAVVFLVILGIMIRKPAGSEKESKDIYQFMESMMEYTTDCAINNEIDYEKIGGLLKECHSNHSTCLNGKGICDVLNDSSFKIIEKSWNVGSYYKGFIFNSTYIENNRTVEGVLSLQRGNCTSFKGAEYLSPDYPGSIVSTLKICF